MSEIANLQKKVDELNKVVLDIGVKMDMLLNAMHCLENVDAKKPVKKPVKKEEETKKAVRKVPTLDEPKDSDEEEETPRTTVKVVKPAPTFKPLDISRFFKEKFEADDGTFDSYITAAVKKAIEKEHKEKWSTLNEKDLKKDKCKVYYQYMKDHHKDSLESLKQSYNQEREGHKMTLLEKE
jgi:hypothetical protein